MKFLDRAAKFSWFEGAQTLTVVASTPHDDLIPICLGGTTDEIDGMTAQMGRLPSQLFSIQNRQSKIQNGINHLPLDDQIHAPGAVDFRASSHELPQL